MLDMANICFSICLFFWLHIYIFTDQSFKPTKKKEQLFYPFDFIDRQWNWEFILKLLGFFRYHKRDKLEIVRTLASNKNVIPLL